MTTTSAQILDDGSPLVILRARVIQACGDFCRAWLVPDYADDAIAAASTQDDRGRLVVARARICAATDAIGATRARRDELTQYEREALTEAGLAMFHEAEIALGMRVGVGR